MAAVAVGSPATEPTEGLPTVELVAVPMEVLPGMPPSTQIQVAQAASVEVEEVAQAPLARKSPGRAGQVVLEAEVGPETTKGLVAPVVLEAVEEAEGISAIRSRPRVPAASVGAQPRSLLHPRRSRPAVKEAAEPAWVGQSSITPVR